MEAATLPAPAVEDEGAPVDGAEATRASRQLFAYSQLVNAGAGAEECEHAGDGACTDEGHFHGFLCLPNSIQHKDILEKAKAAKARRKRTLTDAGSEGRPPSDAYVILEGELDELMAQPREPLVRELAERDARKGGVERLRKLIEEDERFENYWQDSEEHERLLAMPEEERPSEEWATLDQEMTDFNARLEELFNEAAAANVESIGALSEEALRGKCREVRIDGDVAEAHMQTYYMWMGFICTKRPTSAALAASKRVFEKLEEFRSAPPEVVTAIDEGLRDLESRQSRGEAAGN